MSRIIVPRHVQLICRILHAAGNTPPDPPPPMAALTESSCLLVEVAGTHPRGEQAPPGVRRKRLAEAIALRKRCTAALTPHGTGHHEDRAGKARVCARYAFSAVATRSRMACASAAT